MAEPPSEIRKALQRPETQRSRNLTVPAASATGAELNTVKDALDHPPAKPDGVATLIAILAAIGLIATRLSGEKSPLDLAIALISAAGIGIAIYKYFEAIRKKHPLQDRAKAYVDGLIAAQNRDDHSNENEPNSEISSLPTRIVMPENETIVEELQETELRRKE